MDRFLSWFGLALRSDLVQADETANLNLMASLEANEEVMLLTRKLAEAQKQIDDLAGQLARANLWDDVTARTNQDLFWLNLQAKDLVK